MSYEFKLILELKNLKFVKYVIHWAHKKTQFSLEMIYLWL